MKKRGAGHIEFILATVLFVGVVGFVLVLLNPFGGDRTIESSIGYAFDEITKETSVVLDSYSVSITGTGNGVPILGVVSGKNARAVDQDGNPVDAERDGGVTYINRGGKNFFIISFSEEFAPLSVSPKEELTQGEYEISSSNSVNIIFEKKIIDPDVGLIEEYETNYLDLKNNQFNLPGSDFSFSLVFLDEDPVGPEENIPEGLDVFSESRRVEVLRGDGTTEFADLVVRIW